MCASSSTTVMVGDSLARGPPSMVGAVEPFRPRISRWGTIQTCANGSASKTSRPRFACPKRSMASSASVRRSRSVLYSAFASASRFPAHRRPHASLAGHVDFSGQQLFERQHELGVSQEADARVERHQQVQVAVGPIGAARDGANDADVPGPVRSGDAADKIFAELPNRGFRRRVCRPFWISRP